jgi:glutathione S-transferase
MSHELTLFGIGTSRTMRAHWILRELGLDYESHPIQSRTGETLTEQFRRLNPRHKIPVLQHKSFVLTESAAIVQYLSETFADRTRFYVPQDAQARASLNEWSYFIMTELDAGSLYVVRRHEGLPSIYGDAASASVSVRRAAQHSRYSADDLHRLGICERYCPSATNDRLPAKGSGATSLSRSAEKEFSTLS